MTDRAKEVLGVIALLAAVCAALTVRAEMAPNFPPQFHAWLHGLYSPPRAGWPNGEKCCDDGDCRLVETRIRAAVAEGDSGYQAWYGPRDEWLNIPAAAVLRRADNPVANPILCINAATLHIYCLIVGFEG